MKLITLVAAVFLTQMTFAQSVGEKFETFPTFEGVILTKSDGHWQGFNDSFYDTREYSAKKQIVDLADSGKQIECDFAFDTLLPDIELVISPVGAKWNQLNWIPLAGGHRDEKTGVGEISYATNELFSINSNLPVTVDSTSRDVISPRCLNGHWNLGDNNCEDPEDRNQDNCEYICDKYADEPTKYIITRHVSSQMADASSPSKQTPAINLTCRFQTLDKNINSIEKNEILQVLAR